MSTAVNADREFRRTNKILRNKFTRYLFPMFVTMAALSLNEFVDSMLVSRLLGSEGMATVNLGFPVMLIMSVLYTLFGAGGATVYAVSLGERNREKAGKSFSCAMFMAVCTGIGLLLICTAFFGPLSGLLCADMEMRPDFEHYFRVLTFSAPLLVTVLTLTQFLPAAGLPGYATAVNVVANAVNIVMDYVYIKFCGMGVEGAAWATLTGYACGVLVIVWALIRKKLKMCVSGKIRASFSTLPEIIRQGGADVMSQGGFAIQIAVCNGIAASRAGAFGVQAYALCIQVLSVISVFHGALIGAYTPMIALLHGQRDYRGEGNMLKLVLKLGTIVGLVVCGAFLIFARPAAALYNITGPEETSLAVHALRIFSICLFLRGTIILYFRYLKVIGRTGYAIFTGALDGFLGVIPVVLILTQFIGVNGIWYGYALNAALALVFVAVCNLIIARRSGGKLHSVLLLEKETEHEILLDATITKDQADIAGISEKLQKICEANGIDHKDAARIGLAVEEMAVFAANTKTQSSFMDILVWRSEGNIEIDFRSLGEKIDTMEKISEAKEPNLTLLRGISKSVTTEYAMGMNLSHITI